MEGHDFHRDQPFVSDTRFGTFVMIPLVDYTTENGATEYAPSTHHFDEKPPKEFLEKHSKPVTGKAGEAFAVDPSTWHRAGDNTTDEPRPMIVSLFTWAPIKQQIDFCSTAEEHLDDVSDRVKARLGWNVRVCSDYKEYRKPAEERSWGSNQYDMTNINIDR